MRRVFLSSALVFALALSGFAQQVCKRHVETAGGFSFCPPDGWTAGERPDQKYKVWFAPPAKEFTPNINLKDDENPVALAEYVAVSLKYILANKEKVGAESIELLDQSDFVTASGLTGIRMAFRTHYKGLVVRTIQYYFNGKKDQKLIVTVTALEADRETLDPVFDHAVKTFQLEK
jgi:hypothetical protein